MTKGIIKEVKKIKEMNDFSIFFKNKLLYLNLYKFYHF